jgi:hypothetical protein
MCSFAQNLYDTIDTNADGALSFAEALPPAREYPGSTP